MSIDHVIDSLPPLPLTVANVIKVSTNPESSADDLVKAILPDQTMCAAILKIANSVLYGQSGKIGSLRTAIVVLGFQEVQSIVMGKAAISTFRQSLKENKADINKFWEHAFGCGLAAKIIAENLGFAAGEFFIAGLLHDIGKLVLFLALPDLYHPGEWMTSFSAKEHLALEKQRFTICHDAIGGRLFRKWLFPETLITALEYHHCPELAPAFSRFPLVIQLADLLSFLCSNPGLLEGRDLIQLIEEYLPGIESRWEKGNLLWNPSVIESWFSWLKTDQVHGSSIMNILSL
ncbi:MAG: HDOD domain-containing protein [Desulfocapsaceae bacterium]|nr:HDOD domain-containing protein [Desulfocapsaceae bacterium]